MHYRSMGRPWRFGLQVIAMFLISLAVLNLSTVWLFIAVACLVIGICGFYMNLYSRTNLHPTAGIVLVIMTIPFHSVTPISLFSIPLTLTELATVFAILWMLAYRKGLPLSITVHALPIILFFGYLLLNAGWATDSVSAFKELFKWLQVFIVAFVVADLAKTHKNIKPIAIAAAAVLLLEAILGVIQAIFGIGPDSFRVGPIIRAYGTFEQPNPYGGFLALHIPVAFVAVWVLKGGYRISAALILFASLLALTLSLSRGAFSAAIVGLIIVAFLISRKFRIGVVVGMLLVTVILCGIFAYLDLGFDGLMTAYVPDLRDAFNSNTPQNYAVNQRLAFWDAALGMLADRPISGVGLGGFAHHYPKYASYLWLEPLGHAHNIYFNLLAETGLVGLALFMGVAIHMCGLGLLNNRNWVSVAGLGALVVYLTQGLVDNIMVGGIGVYIGASMGFLFHPVLALDV